jgi:hypothetical protein
MLMTDLFYSLFGEASASSAMVNRRYYPLIPSL